MYIKSPENGPIGVTIQPEEEGRQMTLPLGSRVWSCVELVSLFFLLPFRSLLLFVTFNARALYIIIIIIIILYITNKQHDETTNKRHH
jgi:hypothetical protein